MIIKNVKGILIAILVSICCFITSIENVQAIAPDEVAIPVSVQLRGELPEVPEDFVIKMKAMDKYSPMPEEGTVDGIYTFTVTGASSVLLPKIEYKKLGIYTYTIWQEPGNDERCIYDDSIYHLTVSIINSESSNGYDAVVALKKEGMDEKLSEIVFENVYRTSAEVTLAAKKFLDDKTPKAEMFDFVLMDENGHELQTVKNDKDGNVVFDTLSFNQAGEYNFNISEIAGRDSKIIYDETIYDISIKVSPDGETYVAETIVTVDGEVYKDTLVFNNETVSAQPKTGDTTDITMLVLLMSTALMVIAGIMVKKRKMK